MLLAKTVRKAPLFLQRLHRGFSASGLTPQERTQFERDGFCILQNFADRASISSIQREAERIVEGSDSGNMSVFSTVEQVCLV